MDHAAPPGRQQDHGDGPEVARREFGRPRLGGQEVVGLHRDVMIGMVPDAEGHIAGEEVVGVPGMFRAGFLILTIQPPAEQAVVLDVVDRFQHDVRADDVGEVKEQSPRAGEENEGEEERDLAHGVTCHFVSEKVCRRGGPAAGDAPDFHLPGTDHTAGDGAADVGVDAFIEPGGVLIVLRAGMDVVAADVDELVVRVKEERGGEALQELIQGFLRMEQFVAGGKTDAGQKTGGIEEQADFEGVEAADGQRNVDDGAQVKDHVEPGVPVEQGDFAAGEIIFLKMSGILPAGEQQSCYRCMHLLVSPISHPLGSSWAALVL